MTLRPIGRLGFLALAALSLPVGQASAQGNISAEQRQAIQACMPDIRTYCSNVQRGDGRIAACLQQNSERLSSKCRQAVSSLQR